MMQNVSRDTLYKARRQQEKPLHTKQENNKRNLYIQSKKTTQNLSRILYKIKELIQSKKTSREIFSFKARKQLWIYQECITKKRTHSKQTTRKTSSFKASKQLRKLLHNAALHNSVGSENERATYVDIVSAEYLPICI